jgi:hypothetical protein
VKALPDTISDLRESFERARADIAKAHLRCKPNSVAFTFAVYMLARLDRVRNHALTAATELLRD